MPDNLQTLMNVATQEWEQAIKMTLSTNDRVIDFESTFKLSI